MNAELLLREFERVADSPDAMPRLRRFLTGLAITGRLSEQRISEQLAGDLLSLTGKSSGRPVDLPPNWRFAPLGDLIDMRYGKGLAESERAEQGRVAVYGSNGIVGRTESALTERASIVVGRKGSAGALVIADGPSWTTDVAYYIVPPPYFDIRFLFLALAALNLDALGKGVKPGLSRSDANLLPLPLPPLAEQHRIVAKVDELMALCVQLEAAQKEREARRDGLRLASVHRLTSTVSDAATRATDVRFFLDRSPLLITKPKHVAAIRQTILDLAVRGRLSPQDPADEPAEVLLTKIAKRRTHAAAGHLPPKLSTQRASEPDRLPPTWEWATLAEVCVSITDGDHQPPPKSETGIPFLVISNVRSGRMGYQSTRHVSETYYARLDEYHRPRNGDILYTLVGSYGLPVPVEGYEPFCVQRHIGILRPEPEMLQRYLLLSLKSTFSFAQATDCATGIAQKTVPLGGLRSLLVPVPPFAEQQRVVAKVDELMVVCDELQGVLTFAQAGRGRLLEALLHEALEGAAVPLPVEGGAG